MQKSALAKIALIGALSSAPFILNGCGALLLAGGSTAATTTVTEDSRSISTMLYDQKLESQAYDILKSNALLTKPEDFSISVTAFNGNILITGQTVNKDYLLWAIKQIEGLEHVRKVYNYAYLQRPVSASQVGKDSLITSQVKGKLLFGKSINSNRFKVVTENGNVYLMGIVTRDEAQRAINLILDIDGVKKIYTIFDYITISNNSGDANVVNSSDNSAVTVTPVKNSSPVNTSSYVPPVQSQQNGGSYIIEDNVTPNPVQDDAGLLTPYSN